MDDPAIQKTILPALRRVAASDDPAEIARLGGHLAVKLQQQFGLTGSLSSLIHAKELHLNAVNNMDPQHIEYSTILCDASKTLQLWAKVNGDNNAMAQAVDFARRGYEATSPEAAMFVARLAHLGKMLIESYTMTSALGDIEKAVSILDDVYRNHTPLGHPYRVHRLNNLAIALIKRSSITMGNTDIDLAESLLREGIDLLSSQQLSAHNQKVNLASVLRTKFNRTRNISDLNMAIELLDELCREDLTSVVARQECCEALLDRCEETGDVGDLEKAQGLLEILTSSLSEGNEYAEAELGGKWCLSMGRVQQLKYELGGSLEDLDKAITLCEKGTSINEHDQLFTSKALGNFALTLTLKYNGSLTGNGDLKILDQAITAVEKALLLVQGRPHETIDLQLILAEALMARFHRLGNESDLDKIISLTKDHAVMNNSEVRCLSAYANALWERFNLLGDATDLDQAVNIHIQAVQEDSNYLQHAILLTCAADVFHARSEYMGSSEDLEQAITFYQKALDLLPSKHQNQKKIKNNLAYSMRRRYQLKNNPKDLDESINISRSLITSDQSPRSLNPVYTHNLGVVLMKRWQSDKEVDRKNDLKEAVELLTASVDSTPVDHYHRPLRLQVLSEALNFAADALVDKEKSMIKAINYIEEALSLPIIRETHPDRGKLEYVLGMSLEKQYNMTDNSKILTKSIAAYERAAASSGASPSIQVEALDRAAELHMKIWEKDRVGERKHLERAKSLLIQAVDLLYLVSPQTLRRKDQQYQLSHFAGVPARAASLLLECGDTGSEALRLLEKGRGVIASLLLETRMEEGKLEALGHPGLAAHLQLLRNQIDPPPDRQESQLALSKTSINERRYTLQKEYSELLQEIRTSIDESFLLAPEEQSMKDLAGSVGTIVTFNISPYRSDAIITTSQQIYSVSLPALHLDNLRENAISLIQALDKELQDIDYAKARRQMTVVLKWLWTVVIRPVLDSIRFNSSDIAPKCIHWISSSLLHLFPLHAAGLEGKPGQNTMDRVISSYIPSMKALIYAQERVKRHLLDQSAMYKERMLFVGMSVTPGQHPLPAVNNEEESLKTMFGKNFTLAEPKIKATILSELPKYEIFHFAGHGSTTADPSESRLLLHDWQQNPLTVADLTSINLSKAVFACLSACYTAVSTDVTLLDESIHLCSAVMLAGFPTVIGSLWQVLDINTADLMSKLYTGLLSEDTRRLEIERSKFVLHNKLLELREQSRSDRRDRKSDPLVWAPYVHFGV